ncbi:hypothetical protein MFIFM68171_04989 [Madurella fahalii]|uniref:Heterokaryon incompatibility domain-containing protein n=1 Tax=Madurella fahalii TaxID=1157608 RepID=A0ABQ0GAN7_9PEZI
MARWHQRSCSKPQVVAAGGLPYCFNCYSLAPDDISEHPKQITARAPPPGVDRDFNLSWPAAVEYTKCAPVGLSFSAAASAVASNGADYTATTDASRGETEYHSSVYPHLETEESIRLLGLEPGTPSGPLHAYFMTMALGNTSLPEYEALSYTWADASGDAQRRQPIFLGPYWDTVQVTNNCVAALRRVRREHASRFVWVDAVCIDQDNTAERSAQVQLMRTIYARATTVLVYLGEDDGFGDSHLALERLTRMNHSKIFGPMLAWAGGSKTYMAAGERRRPLRRRAGQAPRASLLPAAVGRAGVRLGADGQRLLRRGVCAVAAERA